MRDRRKDKGVKICPQVNMSEVAFLEPLEENGNKSSDDEQEKTGLDLEDKEDDGEGNIDPEI
jgi:hypothetical protein